MQMVFQDPYASLNPRLRVSGIIGEALDAHGLARGAARGRRIAELLEIVACSRSMRTATRTSSLAASASASASPARSPWSPN